MADSSPIHVNGQTGGGLLPGAPSIQRRTVSILLTGRKRPS
jgi:hypothetical protein